MEDLHRTPEELATLRDFVRFAASRFNEGGLVFAHGTDNAIDEAAALVLHTLHLGPELPEAYWGARLTAAERAAIMARVRRRIEERLPLPYLTHEAYFAGLSFYVDRRVMIPRSPLGEWIERGFAPWLDAGAVRRVLDVGTGSGCLAIACAYAFPDAEVDAVDVSEEALAVAEINRYRHRVTDRVHLHALAPGEAPPAGPYELIVANPPYVDAAQMGSLPPEHRHEPRLALAGGEDGLDVVRRLLGAVPSRLAPGGAVVVEVGDSGPALEAAFPDVPFLWLELERGGHGVALLTAEEVAAHRASLEGEGGGV